MLLHIPSTNFGDIKLHRCSLLSYEQHFVDPSLIVLLKNRKSKVVSSAGNASAKKTVTFESDTDVEMREEERNQNSSGFVKDTVTPLSELCRLNVRS